MTFHLAAYRATPGVSAYAALSPVADGGFLPSNTGGFMLPWDLKLIAAYASCTSIVRARITAPSLLRVAYPLIYPVNAHALNSTDPNVMHLGSHPITLSASETVAVEVDGGPTPALAYALLWMCQELVPAPAGERFTLRFASTVATAVRVWSPIGTFASEQSLPQGQYAVVGFTHSSETAVGARLVFPGSSMRPGTLSMGGAAALTRIASRTDREFYEGGLGVYGTFNSFAPPLIEVLSEGADDEHEVYLTVIRLGNQGPIPGPCMPISHGYPGAGSGADLR